VDNAALHAWMRLDNRKVSGARVIELRHE